MGAFPRQVRVEPELPLALYYYPEINTFINATTTFVQS